MTIKETWIAKLNQTANDINTDISLCRQRLHALSISDYKKEYEPRIKEIAILRVRLEETQRMIAEFTA